MTARLCSLNMIVFVPESRRGLRDVESKEFYELTFTSHRAANHVLSQLGVRMC